MKTVMLVLMAVALGGCTPKPTTSQPGQPGEPKGCLPAKTACVVTAGGVSMIRTSKFWLVDLRGSNGLEASALIDATKQCDGPQGCGTELSAAKAKKLVEELGQAKVEQLKVAGAQAAAYLIDQKRAIIQIWAERVSFEEIVRQIAVSNIEGVLCIPSQCVLPPPVPPRDDELQAHP